MVKISDSFVRTSHLVLGLFSFLFLMMYGLSGLQMATVPFRWTLVEDVAVPVDAETASTPRALALALMRDQQMTGELVEIGQEGDVVLLRIAWPGTEHQVTYREGETTARVRTRGVGLVGMLNRIHHAAGLWHESLLLNLWGGFVGVISVALIGLGITGVWLTFRIREERLVGGLVLAGSLVVGLVLIVALRVQA